MYVERLYNMVQRHLPVEIKFHVWTEHDRSVPPHMIKHCLDEWPGVSGPKKSWWYKLQMFNNQHHQGDFLYFDLDTVIIKDLSWIVQETTEHFWTIRDFRYLMKPGWNGINSSIMWWNVPRFSWLWEKFCERPLIDTIRGYPGDQDYISKNINPNQRRFYDDRYVQSWRWQVFDGGMNLRTRKVLQPGQGALPAPDTSILIFHGKPKPHQVNDPVISQHWC